MKAHDDVGAGRDHFPGVPSAVVVYAITGNVTKIVVVPQRGAPRPVFHFTASHLASSGLHIRQLAKSTVSRSGIAGRIARHGHPLVAVVHRGGLMFLEVETNVMYHRGFPR